MMISYISRAKRAPLVSIPMKKITIAATSLLLTACASHSVPQSDTPHPLEWEQHPVAVDEFGEPSAVEDNYSEQIDVDWETRENPTHVTKSETIQVAAIEANSAAKPVSKRHQPSKSSKKKLVEILPPACAEPYRGQDDTIKLATTTHLKLRRGPSTQADILTVFAPGKTITARKLTCGNWTEIVEGHRPIGYLHSYYLTTPD